jgi:hypothetical protein
MANEVANFIPMEATRVGWMPTAELSWDDYIEVGQNIVSAESATQWWIGDWYNQGHKYGEHEKACQMVGIDYARARNCGGVCKSFELSRRRDNVSFSHHQALASLPEGEQDFWLDKCEQGSISRAALRDAIADRGLTTQLNSKATTLEEWAFNVMGPMNLINSDDFFGGKSHEQIAKSLLNVMCEISGKFPGEEARQYRRMLGELKAGADKLIAAYELIPATYDISLVTED